MHVILMGAKTFLQSYNPTNIEIIEKKGNQTVHRFYSSLDMMRPNDRNAYSAALSQSWYRTR